ncbi:hypothetical protein BC829DRAFT_378830, partial [Chytridium lagenaria]
MATPTELATVSTTSILPSTSQRTLLTAIFIPKPVASPLPSSSLSPPTFSVIEPSAPLPSAGGQDNFFPALILLGITFFCIVFTPLILWRILKKRWQRMQDEEMEDEYDYDYTRPPSEEPLPKYLPRSGRQSRPTTPQSTLSPFRSTTPHSISYPMRAATPRSSSRQSILYVQRAASPQTYPSVPPPPWEPPEPLTNLKGMTWEGTVGD